MTVGSSRPAGLVVDARCSPHARLRPVPMKRVRLNDGFWAPRLDTIQRVSLQQQYEQIERDGRLDNFRRAAGQQVPDYDGPVYGDGPVYKWLEAASYALALGSDPLLDRQVDRVIQDVAAAQAPDGYLHPAFTGSRDAERWMHLGVSSHELFLAGHLMQAGIAHHRATRKASLFSVATHFADLICDYLWAGRPARYRRSSRDRDGVG